MPGPDGMLEDMASRLISPALIGRRAELADLEAAFAAARRGEPATVLLGGEAGIGKSRLAAEFAAHARAAGGRVLTGGCLELGAEGLPFAPFTAVLRELMREIGAAGVIELLGGRPATSPGCCPTWARRNQSRVTRRAPARMSTRARGGAGCSSRC